MHMHCAHAHARGVQFLMIYKGYKQVNITVLHLELVVNRDHKYV